MTSTALLLHVARGVSAQPTIAAQLALRSPLPWDVIELEPAEVLHRDDVAPDVVWASRPEREVTEALRRRLRGRPLLVSLPRHSSPALLAQHYGLGADLVLEDERITYAAAT